MLFTILPVKPMKKIFRTLLLGLTLVCMSILSVNAQQEVFGDYTVHYIAVNSNFISPEIAEQYDIVRSPRNAFLNISVIKNTGGTGTAVSATISGEKANFIGQREDITFIEVREGDAIYYLGQFEFSNAENLRFNIEIQPENSGPVYPLSWTTQLYIN
ncbi:MAG: hypothetical protein CMQ38_06420 [Gammaproteobacteria bacterium]|nr:hypothetical protein [Gammaproteobacteria bacterium]